jgi:hypothetical protein
LLYFRKWQLNKTATITANNELFHHSRSPTQTSSLRRIWLPLINNPSSKIAIIKIKGAEEAEA